MLFKLGFTIFKQLNKTFYNLIYDMWKPRLVNRSLNPRGQCSAVQAAARTTSIHNNKSVSMPAVRVEEATAGDDTGAAPAVGADQQRQTHPLQQPPPR